MVRFTIETERLHDKRWRRLVEEFWWPAIMLALTMALIFGTSWLRVDGGASHVAFGSWRDAAFLVAAVVALTVGAIRLWNHVTIPTVTFGRDGPRHNHDDEATVTAGFFLVMAGAAILYIVTWPVLAPYRAVRDLIAKHRKAEDARFASRLRKWERQ